MNMFSVWTLSSLILSYTLALPILNDTSKESSMSILPNFTDQGNGSRGDMPLIVRESVMQMMTPTFEGNGSRADVSVGPKGGRGKYIGLCPTCYVHALDNMLQTGDEKAGEKTQDAYGPGKK